LTSPQTTTARHPRECVKVCDQRDMTAQHPNAAPAPTSTQGPPWECCGRSFKSKHAMAQHKMNAAAHDDDLDRDDFVLLNCCDRQFFSELARDQH